jgi:hypothetical protein
MQEPAPSQTSQVPHDVEAAGVEQVPRLPGRPHEGAQVPLPTPHVSDAQQ